MCMRFGNSRLPWRQDLGKECRFCLWPAPPPPAKPAGRARFAAPLPESRALATPGALSRVQHRREERGPRKLRYRVNRAAGAFWRFWRLPGATSGHRLLWHRRRRHPAPDRAGRPSARCRPEFGTQEFHENLPTRPESLFPWCWPGFCRMGIRRRRDYPAGRMGDGRVQLRDSRRNPPPRPAGHRGWKRRLSRRASPSQPRANRSF